MRKHPLNLLCVPYRWHSQSLRCASIDYDEKSMCWLRMVIWIVLVPVAPAQTFDLRPYGFTPTHNEDYRPQEDSSLVLYLPDGSLLVAFHSQVMIAGAHNSIVRALQPVDLLRLDPQTGKLLAHVRTLVSRDVRYLWPTEHGFLLFTGNHLSTYGNDLKLEREYQIPDGVAAIGVAPALNALAVYLRSSDLDERVKILDLSSFEVRESYTVVNGSHPAFLREGYAVIAHDRQGNRLLNLNRGGLIRRLALPQLPCRSQLQEVSAEAVAAFTCDQFSVFTRDGAKVLEGRLSGDEDEPQVFSAAHAPRFGLASIAGFAGHPLDQQRIHGKEFHISIYDLEKKQKIFSRKVSPLPKIGGSFALSPDGHRLAILKDGEVEQITLQ